MDLSYNTFKHMVSSSIYHASYRSRANLRFGHDFSSKSRAHSRLLREIECRMHPRARSSRDLYAVCTDFSFIGVFISFRANNSKCTKGPNHLSLDLLRRMFRSNIPEALYNASSDETLQYRHVSVFSFVRILISYVPARL